MTVDTTDPQEVERPRGPSGRSVLHRAVDPTAWAVGLLLALTVNGALPFLVAPTTGQAMWAMGFSESLANGELWTLRAHDIGLPDPAPIAFGLSAVWPAAVFRRLGIPTADAYTLIVAAWLSAAYWGAYRITRLFGHGPRFGVVAAVTWLCTPIVWAHAHFGQLALGLALLPLYFHPALLMIKHPASGWRDRGRQSSWCVAVAVAAAFMDGYSFMMMAVGTGLILASSALLDPEQRRNILTAAAPIQLTSLGVAYALYSAYIGKSTFEPHSLDSFRSFAVDLTFIVRPTEGLHWLADLLHLSTHRQFHNYYGDPTVDMTTFALPGLLVATVACVRNRLAPLNVGLALVALFSFYMALGPTLKIHSTRLEGTRYNAMPADAGIVSTGNAYLSETLPGFDVMRASYRWLALTLCASWLLVVLYSAGIEYRRRLAWAVALAVVAAVNLPDLPFKLGLERAYRDSISRIDAEFVPQARSLIRDGEVAVFLPSGNDFLANYLAPRSGFRTLNIGGDKNVRMARESWPHEMTAALGPMTVQKLPKIKALLRQGDVDVVIFPFFNLIDAANEWPCGGVRLLDTDRRPARTGDGRACLERYRADLAPLLDAVRQDRNLVLEETPIFATVRLR